MFCAPEFVSGGTEGVGYRFQVSRSRTRFRRNRGRRGSFSCFVLPVFFLGDTEAAESRFHVLRSRTHFGRYESVRYRF
jgi:hypothetical protein